jgi:flagellar biosynthesis chaperone FliJ
MIFTLVSSAQEWLNTKWDEIRKRRDEYATLKEKEAEEAERVCLFLFV